MATDLKIVPLTERCEGDKRQHVPYSVSFTCPKCQGTVEIDLSHLDYLSYPTWNEPYDLGLYCQECGEYEETIQVIPKITLELVRKR